MTQIDVLIITALKEEYDAAYKVAIATAEHGHGIAEWETRDIGTPTPYAFGTYVAPGGLSMNVALARPTRMGGTATAPVVASLVERLKPRCLAMCGVCAGNPANVALGDVIIAEMVYAYDEGKQKPEGFEGDHRHLPMLDTWVRAAQDLSPAGLPSFGDPSEEEAKNWLLERLYAKDNPYDTEGPTRLPFQIKVGPIASGNVVAKDGLAWDKLKGLGVRSVLGLEMEAATIGSTAHRLGVPEWVVVKGVMDYADARKDDRYKPFAARASAEVLFKFLVQQSIVEPNKLHTPTPFSINAPPESHLTSDKPSLVWYEWPKGEALDVFRLLDWKYRSTPFIGREAEQQELLDWAQGKDAIRVRFVFGPGGAGKSRLANETAEALREKDWSAGQIFLDSPYALPLTGKGLFLLVDYPEGYRSQVRDLLQRLSHLEHPPIPIRVLLLSRLGIKGWDTTISSANATSICDNMHFQVKALSSAGTVELFQEATKSFAMRCQRVPPNVDADAIADWLQQDPELHGLPLFINAAALQCTLTGTNELNLSGRQIVEALVQRERNRLDSLSIQAGWGEKVVSRLKGLAVASGGLDIPAIQRLAREGDIGLPIGENSLPKVPSRDEIRAIGLL